MCRPKQNGGMDIINLSIQNRALLSKHLFKFYSKANIPWVQLIWNTYYDGVVPHATILCGSYWWKDIMRINDTFRMHSLITVNTGDCVLFWHDSWNILNSSVPLRERYPRLFSFVLDDKLFVNDFIMEGELSTLFQLPLSEEAMQELLDIQNGLSSLHRDVSENDVWYWVPGKDQFSAKSYYHDACSLAN